MNTYDAIMAAAAHVERYPQEFNFNNVEIPCGPSYGTPGCALGWIGTFMGGSFRIDLVSAVAERMGLVSPDGIQTAAGQFYSRMSDIKGEADWMHNATECARRMRIYAKKYHAPAMPRQEVVSWASVVWQPRELA